MSRRRPNIIICLCDQLRAFEVGRYGRPTIRTPNIDRMSREGPWFTTACSNSPLCVPARSVILSGQYARTCTGTSSNFCGFPPSRRRVVCRDAMLSEALRDAGYRAAHIGKWHLHPAPDLLGFDEAVYCHNLHQHFGQVFYDLRGGRTVVEGFSPDYETEQVRRFVKANANRPFFLQYSISPPHMPLCDAPAKYTKMYSRDDVVLRDNVWVDGKMVHDADWFRAYMWDYRGNLLLNLKDPDVYMPEDYRTRKSEGPVHGLKHILRQIRALMGHPQAGPVVRHAFPYLDNSQSENLDLVDIIAFYYGMVTCVDDRVGELLDLLDAEGIAEDTIVVFTSDHGDNLGSHHLWMKDRLYEESIRIPLLFRWPGQLAPSRIDGQIGALVDLMPTLLSLAGLRAPETCQGDDLAPVLKGEAAPDGERCAFIETFRHKAIGVRTLDHLYGMSMTGDEEETWQPSPNREDHYFFDLREDPFEMNNLAASDAQPEAADDLRERLLRWHRDTQRRPMPKPTSSRESAAIY